jgi:membrane associated rhomboid family serine protease
MRIAKASLACLVAAAVLFAFLYTDPPQAVWVVWFVIFASAALLGLAGALYAAFGADLARPRRLSIAALSLPAPIAFVVFFWLLIRALDQLAD